MHTLFNLKEIFDASLQIWDLFISKSLAYMSSTLNK